MGLGGAPVQLPGEQAVRLCCGSGSLGRGKAGLADSSAPPLAAQHCTAPRCSHQVSPSELVGTQQVSCPGAGADASSSPWGGC